MHAGSLPAQLALSTDRLILRPLETADVELLWPDIADPEISRLMAWDAHRTREQTVTFVDSEIARRESGRGVTWAILSGGLFCGLISLIGILRTHRVLTYNQAELAYWTSRKHQRRGIMTEAGRRVLDFAFRDVGLHKVRVSHFAENTASHALIRRLGFRYIGTQLEEFSKASVWHDHVTYELLAREYAPLQWANQRVSGTGMKASLTSIYRSPGSHCDLVLEGGSSDGDKIVSGSLVASDGARFTIENGVPDFTWPQQLSDRERATIKFYDGRADVYDKYLPLTFSTFGEHEVDVRNAMVDRLGIGPAKHVLEIGAGTGRDSEIIAARLGQSGELFCQDIARSMLERNRDRLAAAGLKAHFAIANATYLPFDDNVFDAVFQFGGVGEFADIARFFREVIRVTKVGGRVVVGDESMPVWLRSTAFAKILATTNPQFNAPLPLEHLPVEARDVNLRWIIGGTFYLIDFSVGEGEPPADFDFAIPGPRGGTHRTRYVGQLEGVKPETKELAHKAREKLGLSMHDWLDELVGREARKVLGSDRRDG